MNAPTDAVAAILQGHFKGIAVIIDDQVHVEEAIKEIVEAIEAAGGHAIRMKDMPGDTADLENLAGAAFFILDWNLVELGEGVRPPEGFAAAEVERKIAFLRRLREHRHAPIFIFTNEDPEVVKEALRPHEDIYQEGTSNILVRQKADVGKNVYGVLNEWAAELPSVIALKSWERANYKAVNSVFMDLHDRDHLWPVFLWKMFRDDNLAAAAELGRLLNRLVASRMMPPEIDLDAFLGNLDTQLEAAPDKYRKSLLAVMEGERFLRDERLDPKSYSTGDVFTETNEQGNVTYHINIRAECDCIERPGRTLGRMYLLRGREVPEILKNVDTEFGLVREQDNEGIVVAMFDGKHVRFGFAADLKPEKWNAGWKAKRIGRLLPPFLTRLLERYASYSHRPGIPRVPSALVPAPTLVEDTGESAVAGDAPDGDATARG